MKNALLRIFFLSTFMLTASISSYATISSIASDNCPNPACLPHVIQPVVRGVSSSKISTMTVKGQFVDLSTAVQVSGSGVTATYGTRTHGSESSIVIQFSVAPGASLGTRTVSMRYAIETSGPDTFTIRVVRGGSVSSIQRQSTLFNKLTGVRSTVYVAPDAIPVNQQVILRFNGTNIGNATLRHVDARNVQRLNCSETQCEFQVEFTRTGNLDINLVDAGITNLLTPLLYKFHYAGVEDVTVTGTTTSTSGTGFISPVLTSGTSSPATFIDSAPRATMANVFRRSSATADFTQSGFAYFRVTSPENLCLGMSGTQSRVVTIPNPTWGVTNVGTAPIATDFQTQLRSGAQVLDTEFVTNDLAAGATQSFTYARPGDSRLSVFTFLDRLGCFVSPTATEFFEDPPFTVTVDTTNTLAESNESNNSRNF